MLRRTLSIIAALPLSLVGAASTHAQAGQWIGADSASAFVRVDLNLARSRGRWGGHVAYTDTRTGQAICRTALRDTSSVGSTLEFTEVLCGGGVLGLRHEGRQMYFERRGAPGRPGGISDVVLQYAGPLFAQPIQLGQTVSGRLESGDPVLSNETYYDDYAFTAPSAMSLRVTMRSRDIPSYVWVVYGDPPGLKAKGEENTRGGGTDVEVTVDVPAGPVRIRANTYGKGTQGAYTLQVTANQPAALPGRTAFSDQR